MKKTLKTISLLFIMVLLLSSPLIAKAESWQSVRANEAMEWFWDTDSVSYGIVDEQTSDENIIYVNVKNAYSAAGLADVVKQWGDKYQDLSYVISRFALNRADRTFAIIESYCFNKNEEVIDGFKAEGEVKLLPCPPDSFLSALVDDVISKF